MTSRPYSDPAQDPLLQQLAKDWPTLDRYQKGDRVRTLRLSYKLRELEKVLPCNEKRIRDYEILGFVPTQKRASLAKRGTKKLLKTERARRLTLRKWAKLSKGKPRRKLRDKLIAQVMRWLEDSLPPWMWDPFLDEILTLPYFNSTNRKFTPHWWECDPIGDWDKIIEQSRPKSRPGETTSIVSITDSQFAYEEEWFARWYPRCMPISSIANSVFSDVLRKAVRKRLKELKCTEFYLSPWY